MIISLVKNCYTSVELHLFTGMFGGEAIAISSNLGNTSRSVQQQLFALARNCNFIKKANEIHAQIVIHGFSQKKFILRQLLSFYAASRNVSLVGKLFETIRDPNTTIWNQIIRCQQDVHSSVLLFNQMVATGSAPDGYTYSFLLSACSRDGLVKEGEQVHGRAFVNGFCSNLYVGTNLINLYAGTGSLGMCSAWKVFDEMPDGNVVSWNSILLGYIRSGDANGANEVFDKMPERNVVSWTTMIAGCVQKGRCKQALSLFHQMQRAVVQFDQVALVAALSACARLGNLRMGKWIHSYIVQFFPNPLLVSLSNALINMYASCGMVEEASKVFGKMQERNTATWNSIITGFAKHGLGKEALGAFERMLSFGGTEVRPDEITLLGVLCACSHAGLIEDGWNVFTSMIEEWGIDPQIEHYGCVVDLLSRAGFLDEALKLIEIMPMKPNSAIWAALLGGCRIHKNDVIASEVAMRWSVELDPYHVSGYIVLLSNVYAIAKRWEDVACIRQKLTELGMQKPQGQSWIQINGVSHGLVAGDENHRQCDSIYDVL